MPENEPVAKNRVTLVVVTLALVVLSSLLLFLFSVWQRSHQVTRTTERFIQYVSRSNLQGARRMLADPEAIKVTSSGEVHFTAADGTTATLPRIIPMHALELLPGTSGQTDAARDFAVITDLDSGFVVELHCSTRDGKIVIRQVKDLQPERETDESL